MSIRSNIALFYVILAAIVSVTNGPGLNALAGEIALLAVFEEPEAGVVVSDTADTSPAQVHWELEDLPAYLTEDEADSARAAADLAPEPLVQ